jgi:ribosomal protein S8
MIQCELSLKFQLPKFSVIIMKPDQKQLDILQSIKNGQRRDEGIAQELSFKITLVRDYLELMKEQRYIQCQESWDSKGDPSKVDIRLTYKGEVAVTNPDNLII